MAVSRSLSENREPTAEKPLATASVLGQAPSRTPRCASNTGNWRKWSACTVYALIEDGNIFTRRVIWIHDIEVLPGIFLLIP